MIIRELTQLIQERSDDSKAIIILGPRQSGKTTLLKSFLESSKDKVLWFNGDDTDVRQKFEDPTSARIRNYIGDARIIIIDEAQRILNIGLCIKIITDNFPDVKVYATGSSAFELANKINEPLTGRKWEYTLFPISFSEMVRHHGLFEEESLLNHRLVYGYYPEVINSPGNEKDILKALASSYLYKDILTWERIMKPDRLEKLVQALAFQIGNEVSYHELGKISGLDNKTVEKYLILLERAFIVFRLNSFSRNLRNELSKSRKVYFFDNGLRNAIINQFNPVGLRNDESALWENFLVSERYKFIEYNKLYCNRYFWRTQQQQEIDYIEEKDGLLYAWEFKWSNNSKARIPLSFARAYPEHVFELINKENYQAFISRS
jgi:hypothetical protein